MDNFLSDKKALWILVLCTVYVPHIPGCYAACGGYLKPDPIDAGTITSPNYPNNYGNNAMCIWLIEAQSNYAVSLVISGMAGEYDVTTASCLDYVEMRNGSKEETVQYHECTSTTTGTIQARWIWLKFLSNYKNTNVGFTASWSIVADSSTSSLSKPFVECPMEYKCANKECVPIAYRCDGYTDCGCEENSCDEVGCGGFNFSANVKIGIGVGVGVGFFIITFFGIGLLDICLRKRAESKYQARMERQKKLLKQKKAKAMAALFVTQASTDGSRKSSTVASGSFRIPSISTSYHSSTNG